MAVTQVFLWDAMETPGVTMTQGANYNTTPVHLSTEEGILYPIWAVSGQPGEDFCRVGILNYRRFRGKGKN